MSSHIKRSPRQLFESLCWYFLPSNSLLEKTCGHLTLGQWVRVSVVCVCIDTFGPITLTFSPDLNFPAGVSLALSRLSRACFPSVEQQINKGVAGQSSHRHCRRETATVMREMQRLASGCSKRLSERLLQPRPKKSMNAIIPTQTPSVFTPPPPNRG